MGKRPNIVVALTDDHGQWASHCYGNSEIRTPTLDYLAQHGVRMSNAFTPTPVCSPGRACFFTGRLSSQHGIHDWLQEQDDEVNAVTWMKNEVTLAELLRDAGYAVGLSGKWHCGQGTQPQPGFDYWFGLDRWQGAHVEKHTYWLDGKPLTLAGVKASITTDHSVRFLRERDASKPFFLFTGYISTHSPYSGHPERYVDRYRGCSFEDVPEDGMYPFGRLAGESLIPTRFDRNEALAQYYGAVGEIDEGLGRIMDELIAQGELENTLFIYTSDHGLCCSHHGVWGKGNGTRPLNVLEESIRIPMILHHPAGLWGGQVRDEVVTHCDLFQTILDYVDVDIPERLRETRNYPGRSFAPWLTGGHVPDWTELVFTEYGHLRSVRTPRYKLVRRYYESAPCELFDLERDPRETTNLFHDPDHAPLVEELTARIDEYYGRYEDPAKSGLRVDELPRHNSWEAWRGDTY